MCLIAGEANEGPGHRRPRPAREETGQGRRRGKGDGPKETGQRRRAKGDGPRETGGGDAGGKVRGRRQWDDCVTPPFARDEAERLDDAEGANSPSIINSDLQRSMASLLEMGMVIHRLQRSGNSTRLFIDPWVFLLLFV